jgi:hypothetical protein
LTEWCSSLAERQFENQLRTQKSKTRRKRAAFQNDLKRRPGIKPSREWQQLADFVEKLSH